MKDDGKKNKAGTKAVFGSIGLTLALRGLALAGGDTFEQLKGMAVPDGDLERAVSVPSPEAEEVRLSFQRRVPAHLREKLLALCALARDVVADPRAGARFSADPRGYLAERGMGDAALDLESAEVRSVLALGDPEVREAVARRDAGAYLRLMERRGLLRLDTLEEERLSGVTAVSEVAFVVTTVVETCSYTACDALVDAKSVIAVDVGFSGVRSGDNVLGCLAGKSAALLWGKAAAREMLLRHVAEKADELSGEMAELKAARESGLSRERIRAALERKMLEALAG